MAENYDVIILGGGNAGFGVSAIANGKEGQVLCFAISSPMITENQ